MAQRTTVGVVFLALVASVASGTEISLNHANGHLTCGGVPTSSPACVARAADGEAVIIAVVNSAPELLTRKVTVIERSADARKRVLAIISPPVAEQKPPLSSGQRGPARDPYMSVENAVRDISDAVSSNSMESYPSAKQRLRAAIADLAAQSGGFEAVVEAVKKHPKLQRPAGDIDEWWSNVRKLDACSDALAPLPAETRIVTDDLEVTIDFESNNPLVKAPQQVKAVLLLSSGWRLSTTTGFAASRLVDDHYTVRTVIDKPAADGQAATSHREAVREERDPAAAEATLFVNLRRVTPLSFLPSQVSFGVGLATGIKGRLYLGAAYPFGSAGAFTFGVAAGTVKRLSENVNSANLGDVDPEATRRDVFKAAPFIALSWRLE